VNDDLKPYASILRRRFLPFLAVTLGVLALSTGAILAIPPLYRSEATIVATPQDIPSAPNPSPRRQAERRMELIRKQIFARDELLSIADKYALFESKRRDISTTALIELLRKRISIESEDVKIKSPAGQEEPSFLAFSVGFDYETPEIAAKVANELLTLILSIDKKLIDQSSGQSIHFFEKQAKAQTAALAGVEEELTRFKLKNVNSLPDRLPLKIDELRRLNDSLKDIERAIGEEREALRKVQREIVMLSQEKPVPVGISSSPLAAQIVKTEAELIDLLTLQSPEHPDVKAKRRQIEVLRKSFSNTSSAPPQTLSDAAQKQKQVGDIKIAKDNEILIGDKLTSLEAHKKSLEKSSRAITLILNEAPKIESELGLIQRRHDTAIKSLEEANKKLADANEQREIIASQLGERFEVLEQPVTPQEAVWPHLPKLFGMAAGVAGLAGALVAAGLEFLNRSVRADSDILKSVNRHAFAVVPYITTDEEKRGQMRKLLVKIAGSVLCVVLIVAALNYLFMPLDEIYDKVLVRLAA
jgi:polysaccharide biosynthesis transport protein